VGSTSYTSSQNIPQPPFNEALPEATSTTHQENEAQVNSRNMENSFPAPNNRENALEDIFEIFGLPFTESKDYEEEAFRRQMKRRKKKKQRHL